MRVSEKIDIYTWATASSISTDHVHRRGHASPDRRSLDRTCGKGHRLPFPWNTAPVDHILSIPGISEVDKVAMLGRTAAKLLGIES
jgi:hypothetical protein